MGKSLYRGFPITIPAPRITRFNQCALFKDGRNIQPTTYAKNLWDQIRDPLHNLNRAIKPDIFDPKVAQRTFRIAASDLVAILPAAATYKHVASGKLSVTHSPIEIPRGSVSMWWHKRQDDDAELQWLRDHIQDKFVTR